MASKSVTSPGDIAKTAVAIATAVAAAIAWLKDNPEVWEKVKAVVDRVFKRRAAGVAGLRQTLAALQEPLEYLSNSADDAEEARQAKAWSASARKLDQAARLLGDSPNRADYRALKKRVSTLQRDVTNAFLVEVAEDGQRQETRG